MFLPNFIKIDPYNFELYRFKLGAFFSETQCSLSLIHYFSVILYKSRGVVGRTARCRCTFR